MVEIIISGKDNKPPVKFLTIEEMAARCKRSKFSFYKLIERGIMPDANYRMPDRIIRAGERRGQKIKGDRLYSEEILAPELVKIFKGIKRGKPVTQEQKDTLMKAFMTEKIYYTNKY